MTPHPIRRTLKRGALVAAANWPLVLIQFVADTSFKTLLAVPVVGGALLVGAAAGGDLRELMAGDLQRTVGATIDALAATPVALAAFLAAFAVVLVGGSVLMFLVKGGTASVLAAAERGAGPLEQPPLRLDAVARAARFGIDRFLDGAGRLSRRYVTLGSILLVVYALIGGLYLAVVLGAYRAPERGGVLLAWTLLTVAATAVILLVIAAVNLVYLLVQIVMAADDCGLRAGARRAVRLLRDEPGTVAGVFGVVFALVVLGTIASVLAAAGLGLIAFVPFVGFVVFPLQIAAWLLRGVLFQYLGLTALGAYLALYRARQLRADMGPARSAEPSDAAPFPRGRTA